LVAVGLDESSEGRELTRRLRQRGVGMRCPACDWTLDGPLGDYVLVPADGDDPIGLPKGVKLRVFACRNCGYIRLHSANVLREIVES
jgi:rubredoxin